MSKVKHVNAVGNAEISTSEEAINLFYGAVVGHILNYSVPSAEFLNRVPYE
jgi:hypothetical protein